MDGIIDRWIDDQRREEMDEWMDGQLDGPIGG